MAFEKSSKLLKEIYKLGSSKRKDSDSILKEATAINQLRINKKSNFVFIRDYFSRYSSFFHAPKIQFIYEHLFFVYFLMLFSYTLLCKLSYNDDGNYTENNQTSSYLTTKNITIGGSINENDIKPISTPVWQEWFLCVWILGMIYDELIQVLICI